MTQGEVGVKLERLIEEYVRSRGQVTQGDLLNNFRACPRLVMRAILDKLEHQGRVNKQESGEGDAAVYEQGTPYEVVIMSRADGKPGIELGRVTLSRDLAIHAKGLLGMCGPMNEAQSNGTAYILFVVRSQNDTSIPDPEPR
mgnify:CR=1 FL=1